jgi:ketosteroid isomerase-like protein
MIMRSSFLLVFCAALCLSSAFAQDIRDDEADVLLTIEQEWEASLKRDHDKVDAMLADNFMGWSKSSPAPRTKTSSSKWRQLEDSMGRVLRYELYPLSITVEGDVAVAHYLYTQAFKPKDGEVEITNGRYTDVLIRSEDGWKFLAWHGGDDD